MKKNLMQCMKVLKKAVVSCDGSLIIYNKNKIQKKLKKIYIKKLKKYRNVFAPTGSRPRRLFFQGVLNHF